MRVKAWTLVLTWEDGVENDVSNYIPEHTAKAIEQFIDYWEDKYKDESEEE